MEAAVSTLNWHLGVQMKFHVSGFLIHISPNVAAAAFKWVLPRGDRRECCEVSFYFFHLGYRVLRGGEVGYLGHPLQMEN